MHVEHQGSDRLAHPHSLIRAFSACKVLDMMKVKDKKLDISICVVPIAQLRMCVIKKVTFKGGHLMWQK